jgi:uncharacterized protein YbaP (TraB family)
MTTNNVNSLSYKELEDKLEKANELIVEATGQMVCMAKILEVFGALAGNPHHEAIDRLNAYIREEIFDDKSKET